MSFVNGLRRALGLPDKYDEEANGSDIIEFNASPRTPYINPFKKKGAQDEHLPASAPVEISSNSDDNTVMSLPGGIFDGLLEVINGNLSPLVRSCIDVDAEKKYLYDTLGASFQEFVTSTRESAFAAARESIEKERAEMKDAIAVINERCSAAEKRVNEMKDQKQSEERQKNALKERIKDLEKQVATAEAEREQFDLENKSLVNKLKVSRVKADDSEFNEKEVARLNKEVNTLKEQLTKMPSADAYEEEYKAKMEVTNALISSIRAELVKKDDEITSKDEKIKEIQAALDEATENLVSLKAELEDASLNLAIADEIQGQLDKVEDFKQKKNKEVADLTEKVNMLQSTLDETIKDKDETLAKLEEKLQSAHVKESELTQKVINLNSNLEEHRKHKDSDNNKAVSDLKAQLEDANLKVASYQSTIDKLESQSKEYEAKMQALAESEKMAGDVLKAKIEEVESLKASASELDGMTEELDRTAKELNRVKLESAEALNKEMKESAEKIKGLQAEVAELQARLNVHARPDDSLVDSDLRQAVEDTFDVSLDDNFGDFEQSKSAEVTDAQVEKAEVVSEKSDEPSSLDVEIDDIDDIDWLLPTPPNEPEPEPMQEVEPEKPQQSHESQMSLF